MSEEAHLVDEYELLNCIATGSVTQIWEVMEQGTGRRFAMKLMMPEAFNSFTERGLLRHEAKVCQQIAHPNIIQFQEISLKKPNGYILMEYFRALNMKVQLRSDLVGLRSRLKTIMEGVCQGLASMHDKGWIHMDVKPENLLANKSGEVKIIDFALSKRPGGNVLGLGKKKPIKGTRTYLAPETIRRKGAVPATDLYSLGISMYEVMTGSAPFSGASPDILLENHLVRQPTRPSKINENISPDGDAIVLKLLNKRPEDRYATAHELYSELKKASLFKVDPLELFAEKERERKAKEEEHLGSIESKLDSRADALRVEKGLAQISQSGTIDLRKSSGGQAKGTETPAKQPPAPQPSPQQRPSQPAAPAPGQSGQMNVPPGQPVPGQPVPGQPGAGQPYPGQPYPGQPYPNQPYPNQGYPGQGYPPPGYPNQPYPGQPYPQQGAPGQPYPGYPGPPQGPGGQQVPAQPGPGQPPAQTPGQPPVAPGQPPQQRPPAQGAPGGQQNRPAVAAPNPIKRPEPPPVPEDPGDDLPEMDELPPVS